MAYSLLDGESNVLNLAFVRCFVVCSMWNVSQQQQQKSRNKLINHWTMSQTIHSHTHYASLFNGHRKHSSTHFTCTHLPLKLAYAMVNFVHNLILSSMHHNPTAIERYRYTEIGTHRSYGNRPPTSHHSQPNEAVFRHHAISNSFYWVYKRGNRLFYVHRMRFSDPFSWASSEWCTDTGRW